MQPELLEQSVRQPAIPQHELQFPGGEFANKKTLQQAALAGGLPVPEILTEEQAREILKIGEKEYLDSIQAGIESPSETSVYLRGYFDEPVDMWAVDTLPTFEVASGNYLSETTGWIAEHAAQPRVSKYLQQNFGATGRLGGKYFIQMEFSNERIINYASTLTFGSTVLCNAHVIDVSRGVNWCAFDRSGSALMKSHWYYEPETMDEIASASVKATSILNKALTGRLDVYSFKHDFLFNHSDMVLIQSRVASRNFSDNDIQQQEEAISRFIESGVRTVKVEPSGYDVLMHKRAPQEPYVLVLTNDKHGRLSFEETMMNLDLTSMIGLKLPKYLRGGLLAHSGYTIIAYALYWGIPVAMTG